MAAAVEVAEVCGGGGGGEVAAVCSGRAAAELAGCVCGGDGVVAAEATPA